MIWQFNPCKSRETLNFHTVPTVIIGMLRSDGWRFGFAFNKSFPTVYFGADVSASCLCWKDAAWDWFNIKKSRHMAGNSHYADIRIDKTRWDRLSPQWEFRLSQLEILILWQHQHIDIDQAPGMTCMKTKKKKKKKKMNLFWKHDQSCF